MRGGGVNAIWAMPTWGWRQVERGFPYGNAADDDNNVNDGDDDNAVQDVPRTLASSTRDVGSLAKGATSFFCFAHHHHHQYNTLIMPSEKASQHSATVPSTAINPVQINWQLFAPIIV